LKTILTIKFNIIIPTYNGSTDETYELVKPLLRDYKSKLKYIKKQNGGVASARNLGIDKQLGIF